MYTVTIFFTSGALFADTFEALNELDASRKALRNVVDTSEVLAIFIVK